MSSYSDHFVSYRHDVSGKAREYCCGLMQAGDRKNMDRMAEVVPGSVSRNLQQFLTHSKWSWRSVMDQVAVEVDELIGQERNSCLLIDETSFPKQGRSSVGVSRQWLGRLGKVDNGQVAVFSALSNGKWVCPVDARLYLPKGWCKDAQRCEAAGIPEDYREFKTKETLALESVTQARANGLHFGWVGADAGYGKGPGFMFALEDMGERFLLDVHRDFGVYLEHPRPYLPPWRGSGRKPRLFQVDTAPIQVSDLVDNLQGAEWKWVKLRDATRGPLRFQAYKREVYVWDRGSDHVRRLLLVATRTVDGKDIKISLCNFPESTPLKQCAARQRQRYWVERGFQDAKSECGMADYQVRKWSAWHHHIALVMMSMRFMLGERIRSGEQLPLLSCADIEALLAHFLPRRDSSKQEILRQLQQRHTKRQSAIESHTRASEKRYKKRRRKPASQEE